MSTLLLSTRETPVSTKAGTGAKAENDFLLALVLDERLTFSDDMKRWFAEAYGLDEAAVRAITREMHVPR